jgi:hypothetical protein
MHRDGSLSVHTEIFARNKRNTRGVVLHSAWFFTQRGSSLSVVLHSAWFYTHPLFYTHRSANKSDAGPTDSIANFKVRCLALLGGASQLREALTKHKRSLFASHWHLKHLQIKQRLRSRGGLVIASLNSDKHSCSLSNKRK